MKLLEILSLKPKHIVFINDKLTHVRDVEGSVELSGIEFTGLRYTFSDERVQNFRQDIAEIQWTQSSFNYILSDEEALAILSTQ